MIEISEERDVTRAEDKLIPGETRTYIHLKFRVPRIVFNVITSILALKAIKEIDPVAWIRKS